MELWVGWLIISGLMFILEILTAGFLVFWFGVAALLTMVLSLFVDSIVIQIIFFIILSFILVLATKPIVSKYVLKGDMIKTNVYTVIGKTAIVTMDIDIAKGTGQIKVGSDVWSAKSENQEFIPAGSMVEIVKVEGVKVIVKKINENNNEEVKN